MASAPLFAQTTTVTQAVTGPDGNPGNGTVSFRVTAACVSGSNYVGAQTTFTTFLAGAFSFGLVPNDTCVPAGTSYIVGWNVCTAVAGATLATPCPAGRGTSWTETWVVPTSGSPVTVGSVRSATTPLPTYVVQWQQLSQNGATPGQAPVWNGASWQPGAIAGVAGPAGPTGAASTVAGPVGPTGAASTVAGPAGAASTVAGPVGPTGAASTVAGPVGPTGAASTVAGPSGSQGIQGVTGATGPTLFPVNPQTATYQATAADFAACKTITAASGTFTITLVASSSQPANGACIHVISYSSGVVSIAVSGQNNNGGIASLTLPASSAVAPSGAFVVSDGTNYTTAIWKTGIPTTASLTTNTCAATSFTFGNPSTGVMAGSMLSGTTGTCAVVITFSTAAAHGWVCGRGTMDLTQGGLWAQTPPLSATSCTISGTGQTSGDTLVWMAISQ